MGAKPLGLGVAKQFHLASSTVRAISLGHHFHQQTNEEQLRRQAFSNNHGPTYLPTPEEIHQACLKIRAARCDDDDPAGWMPPVVTDRMMGLALCSKKTPDLDTGVSLHLARTCVVLEHHQD